MKKYKSYFPIFQKFTELSYLDTASTSQTPQVVIDAMDSYYTSLRANTHRSAYYLSDEATKKYEDARSKVARFIGADSGEVVFTSGTTSALNMLVRSLTKNLVPRDNVVLTKMEHHANLLPWQEMAKERGFELRFIDLDIRVEDNSTIVSISENSLDSVIDETTKIIAFTHVSNVTGTRINADRIVKSAKKVGAITIVDAAQSVGHMTIDVRSIDCDFLVFSGHKMCGPTGIGVLYGKRARLESLEPSVYGGGMVNSVSLISSEWGAIPQRFEAGTPNISGAIGLGAAIDFLEVVGVESIDIYVRELYDYIMSILLTKKNIHIYRGEESSGILSLSVADIHPHDVMSILDQHDVAVRAGYHCAEPLMRELGVSGTIRISLYFYNTEGDIDRLSHAIDQLSDIFKKKS
jgi:cysteine desulfurase / selenocysteine lyase